MASRNLELEKVKIPGCLGAMVAKVRREHSSVLVRHSKMLWTVEEAIGREDKASNSCSVGSRRKEGGERRRPSIGEEGGLERDCEVGRGCVGCRGWECKLGTGGLTWVHGGEMTVQRPGVGAQAEIVSSREEGRTKGAWAGTVARPACGSRSMNESSSDGSKEVPIEYLSLLHDLFRHFAI